MPSRSVFCTSPYVTVAFSILSPFCLVGNTAYEATEEELIILCREIGPVVSLRLVYDKDTGKPKGVGQCEYADEATVQRAVRDLNGRDVTSSLLVCVCLFFLLLCLVP